MRAVCAKVHALSSDGGAIYFMQREKNTEFVFTRPARDGVDVSKSHHLEKRRPLRFQGGNRFGKHYQIIAFATKGRTPRVFHRLRIDPPLPKGYKHARTNGMFVTDVWDDIRELTSGYYAGDEALRSAEGERLHKQQAPIQLLLRIVLSSTNPGDHVLDPFAGSGTTLIAADQLGRKSVGIELDAENIALIRNRLNERRKSDDAARFYKDYACTPNLDAIWGNERLASPNPASSKQPALLNLFNR